MLRLNDQMHFTKQQDEEQYSIMIPEDNFLIKLNRLVNFTLICESIRNASYTSVKYKADEDIIKLFKYLLLKEYYKKSDIELIEKSKYELTFKKFLNSDYYATNSINSQILTDFRHEKMDDTLVNVLSDNISQIANKIDNKKDYFIMQLEQKNIEYILREHIYALIYDIKESILKTSFTNSDVIVSDLKDLSSIINNKELIEKLQSIINKIPHKIKEKLRLQLIYLEEIMKDIKVTFPGEITLQNVASIFLINVQTILLEDTQ